MSSRKDFIDLCCRKPAKGKSVEEIADDLECEHSQINSIVGIAQKYAPNYDPDMILEELSKESYSQVVFEKDRISKERMKVMIK